MAFPQKAIDYSQPHATSVAYVAQSQPALDDQLQVPEPAHGCPAGQATSHLSPDLPATASMAPHCMSLTHSLRQ